MPSSSLQVPAPLLVALCLAAAAPAVLGGATLGASDAPWTPPKYEAYMFDQPVDCLAGEHGRSWGERYLVTTEYFDRETGPVLFYTGNEGEITDFWAACGFVFEQAKKLKALVVFAEHRYYGTSLPFKEESWTNANLKFLTVDQALCDFSRLIAMLNVRYGDRPLVAFGGSYGGMLSGWFRQHYPDIVDGALAASAPDYMAFAQTPPQTFFEIVTKDFEMVEPKGSCSDRIRSAFKEVTALSKAGQYQKIGEAFGTCKVPEGQAAVDHLLLWAETAFTNLAMGDYPYQTKAGGLPGWPVKAACKRVNAAPSDLAGLSAAVSLVYNVTQDLTCFDIYKQFVFCSDQTGCGGGPAGKSWDYQACTEIIMPTTTTGTTDMFPPRVWSVEDLTGYCMNKFGVKPDPQGTAAKYGDWTNTTNVVFSNGLLDPWHGGGYLKDLAPTLPAVIIAEGAHHLDLRAAHPQDPESVIVAREIEGKHIAAWVQEGWKRRRGASMTSFRGL